MSLYLVESTFTGAVSNQDEFAGKLALIQEELSKRDVRVVEVQVSSDYSRAFFIFESAQRSAIEESLRSLSISIVLIKPVRLIGSEVEAVQQQKDAVNYLVEWNLPEHLTMDQYLERKKTNSVHYDEVPEVEFSRTYVCEDMTKCLCFYVAPDESAVKKAREAVKAPIDSITKIAPRG